MLHHPELQYATPPVVLYFHLKHLLCVTAEKVINYQLGKVTT